MDEKDIGVSRQGIHAGGRNSMDVEGAGVGFQRGGCAKGGRGSVGCVGARLE